MTEFISTCSMPLAIVFLIAGFFLLVKGADVFVEGSSSIAKRFHVPAIIIGLTIVAMGTSLPETAVSVVAAIQHKNTLAISNVVGSNIFNMMVVIGFCAIMTPVAVQKATLKRDFPYSVFAALLLMILGGVGMKLGRFDSAVFLVFFAIFIGTMIRMALKAGKEGGQLQSEEIEAAEAQKVDAKKPVVPCGWCSWYCDWRGCRCRQCQQYCIKNWNEPDAGRTDHCFNWNLASGTCDICCCSSQK